MSPDEFDTEYNFRVLYNSYVQRIILLLLSFCLLLCPRFNNVVTETHTGREKSAECKTCRRLRGVVKIKDSVIVGQPQLGWPPDPTEIFLHTVILITDITGVTSH